MFLVSILRFASIFTQFSLLDSSYWPLLHANLITAVVNRWQNETCS